MERTVFKGFLVVMIAVTSMNLAVTESHAAKEWGEICWLFSHPDFTNGNIHRLIVTVSHHGDYYYALHGSDECFRGPLYGTAYYSPRMERTLIGQTYNTWDKWYHLSPDIS